MTPTTFPCPFCGRKMGDGPGLLGRHVRCPHCKQVILAPAATPTPAPPAAGPPPAPVSPPPAVTAGPTPPGSPSDLPVFKLPSPEAQESIFGEAAVDDVLSSDHGRLPVPELPPPVAAPPPPPVYPKPVVVQPPPAPRPPTPDPFAGFSAGPAYPTPAPPAPPPVAAVRPAVPAAPANPWEGLDPTPVAPHPVPASVAHPRPHPRPEPEPLPAAIVEDEPSTDTRPDRRPKRDARERPPRAERGRVAEGAGAGGGMGGLIKIGFFVLLPYAFLMTVLAAYGLFIREGGKVPEGHPLSLIPDTRGAVPPADRKKTGKLGVPLDGPLPPELRVALGKTVAVGDVEVEPTGVALRRLTIVKVLDSGKKARYELPGKAVVLTLSVRNTSPDLSFHPLDPAFNRKGADAPATQLVVGKGTHPGGAVGWPFERTVKRAYEAAQEDEDRPLGPGESRSYVVTSDAKPDVVQAVQGAKDTVLWRVQVRRGLVEYRGREVPVTALIGVEFRAADVTEE